MNVNDVAEAFKVVAGWILVFGTTPLNKDWNLDWQYGWLVTRGTAAKRFQRRNQIPLDGQTRWLWPEKWFIANISIADFSVYSEFIPCVTPQCRLSSFRLAAPWHVFQWANRSHELYKRDGKRHFCARAYWCRGQNFFGVCAGRVAPLEWDEWAAILEPEGLEPRSDTSVNCLAKMPANELVTYPIVTAKKRLQNLVMCCVAIFCYHNVDLNEHKYLLPSNWGEALKASHSSGEHSKSKEWKENKFHHVKRRKMQWSRLWRRALLAVE